MWFCSYLGVKLPEFRTKLVMVLEKTIVLKILLLEIKILVYFLQELIPYNIYTIAYAEFLPMPA